MKPKTTNGTVITLSILCLVLMICTSCKNTQANDNDIAFLQQISSTVNSAQWCSYVNETQSTITIKHTTMANIQSSISKNPSSKTYVINKSQLTKDQLTKFQNLNKPTSK